MPPTWEQAPPTVLELTCYHAKKNNLGPIDEPRPWSIYTEWLRAMTHNYLSSLQVSPLPKAPLLPCSHFFLDSVDLDVGFFRAEGTMCQPETWAHCLFFGGILYSSLLLILYSVLPQFSSMSLFLIQEPALQTPDLLPSGGQWAPWGEHSSW